MVEVEERILEFAREIAKKRSDENELGFWIFHPDMTLDLINRFRRSMGKVNIYYAVKCNPCPYLVKFMLENGDGFDCASVNEIKEVIKLGGDPKNISYSQIAKTISEIKESYKLGVRLTLVDCIEEVEKIAKIKDEVKDLKIMIRFQSNDPSAAYSLGGRFGADEEEIEPILNAIHKHGLNMCGVHFHVGVGCENPSAYDNGIKIAKETFDKAKKLGYKPNMVDIGGGFSHEKPIENFGKVIQDAIKKYGMEECKFIAEPGQYIARKSFSYVANIILKKRKLNKDLIYYSLDDGRHGALGYTFIFSVTAECIPLNPRGRPKVHSIFGGQTCDSHDIVSDFNVEEMEIGDWVIYPYFGAYSISIASNFNGFESRTKPIFHLPMKDTGYVVKIPEEIEKNGVPSLWGLPNTWSL